MKKTLSLLTIVALMFSATASYAKEVTLNTSGGYDFTPELEVVLAPGATLINTLTGNDFADWYSSNKVEIVGRFTNGDYTAYVIGDTSYPSGSSTASTYGGLVFFNNSVATDVLNA